MRAIALLFGLLLPFLAAPLDARVLPIRSGEHAGFSRLVITIPANTSWQLKSSGRQAAVTVNVDEAEFDTASIFTRIPATRLAAASQRQKGAPLDLALKCDCEVSAFVQAGTLLVIDIADRKEPTLDVPVRRTGLPTAAYRFQMADLGNRPLAAIGRSHIATKPAMQSVDVEAAQMRHAGQILNVEALDITQQAGAMNLSEQRLLEQIDRAASQGLLTPVASIPVINGAPVQIAPNSDPGSSIAPHNPIAVETGAERDITQLHLRTSNAPDPVNCIDPTLVAVHDWSDGRPYGLQIGDIRRSLYSEIDMLRQDRVADLIKLQLFFGFGAEALHSAHLLDQAQPETAILRTLAQIIEATPATGASPLEGQAHCESEVALWSFLGSQHIASIESDGIRNAILQSFSKLPEHLRAHVGPRLSARFLESGDPGSAEEVLRAIDRSMAPAGSEEKLVHAALDAERGDAELAREKLRDVVDDNTELSPEALIRLIESEFEADGTIAPELPELVAAYYIEHRNSDLAQQLRRAHALALALRGEFAASFAIVRDDDHALDDTAEIALRHSVTQVLTRHGSDVEFLTYSFAQLDQSSAGRPVALGNEMARRYLDLGFADAATEMLALPEPARKSRTRKMMRAEIALHRGLPHRALVELAGLEDAEADAFRARAFALAGEHGQAAQAFDRIADLDRSARSRWLSGTWVEPHETGENPYLDAVETARMLIARDDADLPAEPLATASALLSKSTQTRSEVAHLLGVLDAQHRAKNDPPDANTDG